MSTSTFSNYSGSTRRTDRKRSKNDSKRKRNAIKGASVKVQPVSLRSRLQVILGVVGGLYRVLIFTLIAWLAFYMYGHRALVTDFINRPVATIAVAGEMKNIDRPKLKLALSGVAAHRFFELEVDSIAEDIRKMPWVQDVQIRKQWPDRVSVVIVERVPVARWTGGALVDEVGQLFSSDGAMAQFANLPLLHSPNSNDIALVERFQSVAPRFASQGLQIEQMTRTSADSWSIKLINGPDVILGKQKFDLRIERFFMLRKTLKPEQFEKIATMDFRYSNGVAVSEWSKRKIPAGYIANGK